MDGQRVSTAWSPATRSTPTSRSIGSAFWPSRDTPTRSSTPTRSPSPAESLFDEDALVDELLGHPVAVALEPALVEALAELQIDLVDAVAVLLKRDDSPVTEPVGVARVVDQVVASDDVVLLVHDQDCVGLVRQCGRATHVLGAHALPRRDASLVGSHDGEDGHVDLHREVFESFDNFGD